MSQSVPSLKLPSYDEIGKALAALALPITPASLHATLSAYGSIRASKGAEAYIQALVQQRDKEAARHAHQFLFNVWAAIQSQLATEEFDFQLLLPGDEVALDYRAQEFGLWCRAYMDVLHRQHIHAEAFEDEDLRDIFQHLQEFANVDYSGLDVDEEDEKALVEVTEYTRMAVLRMYSEFNEPGSERGVQTHH